MPSTIQPQLPPTDWAPPLREASAITSPAASISPMASGTSPLTSREHEVLLVAADGAPVADVAAELHLSPGTVRNHLSAAIGKTGARTRADAVRVAVLRRSWVCWLMVSRH